MRDKVFLNAVECSRRYGVAAATWANWRSQGRIPDGVKINGSRRWSLEELEAWEQAGFLVSNSKEASSGTK